MINMPKIFKEDDFLSLDFGLESINRLLYVICPGILGPFSPSKYGEDLAQAIYPRYEVCANMG